MNDVGDARDGAAREYLAEYADGPLAGSTERRALIDGAAEETISAYVAVEGIETMLSYHCADSRMVAGLLHTRYLFSPSGSDPYQEDREDGSGTISEVV